MPHRIARKVQIKIARIINPAQTEAFRFAGKLRLRHREQRSQQHHTLAVIRLGNAGQTIQTTAPRHGQQQGLKLVIGMMGRHQGRSTGIGSRLEQEAIALASSPLLDAVTARRQAQRTQPDKTNAQRSRLGCTVLDPGFRERLQSMIDMRSNDGPGTDDSHRRMQQHRRIETAAEGDHQGMVGCGQRSARRHKARERLGQRAISRVP